MLINSVEFYERILYGLHSDDPQVREYANGCLSHFSFLMREPVMELPDDVAAMLAHLPELHKPTQEQMAATLAVLTGGH